MRQLGPWLVAALLSSGCSGAQRPAGPAPEYERPELPAWDAAIPSDPFEQIEGEEVTDDEPTPTPAADAGTATPLDAAADSPADAGGGG